MYFILFIQNNKDYQKVSQRNIILVFLNEIHFLTISKTLLKKDKYNRSQQSSNDTLLALKRKGEWDHIPFVTATMGIHRRRRNGQTEASSAWLGH